MDLTMLALIASIAGPVVLVADRILASRKNARDEGVHEGGIKVAIELLAEVRNDVRQIPALVQRVATLEGVHARITSEHAALRGKVESIRVQVASIHDGE